MFDVGCPIQVTSDKGTETMEVFAAQSTLRYRAAHTTEEQISTAHQFLGSTRNIVVERTWRFVRENVVDIVRFHWEKAQMTGVLVWGEEKHRLLYLWLWLPLAKDLLQTFITKHNTFKIRNQKKKLLPSGCSRTFAYDNPERWGGSQCLVQLSTAEIDELMTLYDQSLLNAFYSTKDDDELKKQWTGIGSPVISIENVWIVFERLISIQI